MDKLEMKKGLEAKVSELLAKVEAVEAHIKEITALKLAGEQAIADLKAKKEEKKAEMNNATDLVQAKAAMKAVESLEKDIEIQEALNAGQLKAKKAELEGLAEDFFKLHAQVKTMYQAMDTAYLLEASANSIEDDIQLLNSLAFEINEAFNSVKRALFAQGLVQQGDIHYKGTHLGQMGLMTKLKSIEAVLKDIKKLAI